MNWKSLHRYQENSGWCGQACIQMMLLAVGVQKTQAEIAKDTYLPWWGTPNHVIIAYLSQYFTKVDFSTETTLVELKKHIDAGHLVLVNWMDNLDPEDAEDGHYSLVAGYSTKNKTLTLVDPTSTREGLWEINEKEFQKIWYDFLDLNRQLKNNRWLCFVDPKSVK